MSYLGNGPGVASQRITDTFSVTTSTTTFTPSSGYTIGYLDVYHNGVKLVNGDDYTASNGSTFALTSAAQNGDTVECVAYIPRGLSDGYTKAEADAKYPLKPTGTPTGSKFLRDDNTWQTVTAPSPTAVSDQANSSTGYFDLPSGTTAQRPASPNVGMIRFNTDLGALENYTTIGWTRVSAPIPVITSISGGVYSGAATTLTFSGTNFESGQQGKVTFTSGGTVVDVGVTPSSETSFSVTVPSGIYSLSSGAVVSVKYTNADNAVSTAQNLTILGLPTGGAVTTSGGNRIHTFTSSSSNFVVPSGFTATASYLIVAGGGGGGNNNSGGGGAGGMLTGTTTISANTYTISIGAGGVGSPGSGGSGANGSNTSAFGLTAIGGGGGMGGNSGVAESGSPFAGSGGSGGGQSRFYGTPGSGTAGQGNSGAASPGSSTGGGGGGKGGAGIAQNGGVGAASSISGTSVYYAGGGGGSSETNAIPAGNGGNGGGGGGGIGGPASPGSNGWSQHYGQNGSVNTGGGGGGGDNGSPMQGGTGGSGIVIVSYPLPT